MTTSPAHAVLRSNGDPSQATRAIEIFDTTLRDGTQGEGISLSVLDKLQIAKRLDELGFDYIEGGYPLSNPKDVEFFARAQAGELTLRHAQLVAFGMTRRRGTRAADDAGIQALLAANTPVVCVVGKSWDLHIKEVLGVDEAENLSMIADSVGHLAGQGRRVLYDAEHFFDGYRANPACALATIRAAREAGAECVILCDTNGGSLPGEVYAMTERVVHELGAVTELPAPLAPGAKPFRIGIHVHNDGSLATANTLAAVQAGATHVQGTINGIGERCGNVDLTAAVANLGLKLGYRVLGDGALARMTELSRFVDEQANLVPRNNQPFVGISAFAHKGGMHVHAIAKVARSYEHIDPATVGNQRRVLVSELGGQSNIAAKIGERYGITNRDTLRQIQHTVNQREAEGYQYEAAEASFDLLVRGELGLRQQLWEVLTYRCEVFRDTAATGSGDPVSEATIKLRILGAHAGIVEHHVAEGNGPVDALASALRRCLRPHFAAVDQVKLIDFKVRVVDGRDATRARVRVEVEWRDEHTADVFTTVGVSQNIIDASYLAIADGLEYRLSGADGARALTRAPSRSALA